MGLPLAIRYGTSSCWDPQPLLNLVFRRFSLRQQLEVAGPRLSIRSALLNNLLLWNSSGN